MPIIFAGDFDDLSHQFGVADGETIAVELDGVFQAGAAMPTKFKTPLVDFKLVSCHPGGGPGSIRQNVAQLGYQEFP